MIIHIFSITQLLLCIICLEGLKLAVSRPRKALLGLCVLPKTTQRGKGRLAYGPPVLRVFLARYVKIEKCIECRYPTKNRFRPIPGGRGDIALCLKCFEKIPKAKSPFDSIIEEDERLEKNRSLTKLKD